MSREGFIPGLNPTHSSIYLGPNIRSVEFDEETVGLISCYTWESTDKYTSDKVDLRSILWVSHSAYLIVWDMKPHFLEVFGNCILDFTFDLFFV